VDENEKIIVAILTGALTVLLAVLIALIFNFNLVENIVLFWIFTTLYAIFAILITGSKIVPRLVEKPVYVEKIVEKPVYIDKPFPIIQEVVKEIPLQVPIENKTVEIIEKPIYMEKTIKPRTKKLEIPHYKFIGSNQTRRYHTRFCRLGKLIKKKYKIHSNSQAFFRKKKYKPCKVCIKRR